MKENLFRTLASAAMIGAFSVGCSDESRQAIATPAPSPIGRTIGVDGTPVRGIKEADWAKLSAFERIQRLEFKQYPTIEGFSATNELKLASAQFYCQETKCEMTPGEMANNIFFVSPFQFIEEAQKDVGREYTQQEIENQLNTRVEMVDKDNKSFINIELYNKTLKLLRAQNPEIVKQLGLRDFDTVVEKSLFLHICSHMNQTKEQYSFNPFSLVLPSKNGPIKVPKVDKLDGFTFVGIREDGSPAVINGAREAITERSAINIGKKAGDYLPIGRRYSDGALLIDMLNKRSGITNQEFLEYANGTRTIRELLRKWGSIKNPSNPDEKGAVRELAMVGLYVDGFLTKEQALQSVNDWLKPEQTR